MSLSAKAPRTLFVALFALFTIATPAAALDVGAHVSAELVVSAETPYPVSWQNRLQLQLSQPLGPVDAVATLDAVQGATPALTMSEASLAWYGERTKVQVGRGLVNWGTAMKLNPTNVINPINVLDPDLARLPVQFALLSYYPGSAWELTAVWLPEFVPAMKEVPGNAAITFDFPDNRLENTQAAARVVYRGTGYDVTLIGARRWDPMPTVTPTPQGPVARFQRLTTVGAGAATGIGPFGVWGEGAASVNEQGDWDSEIVLGTDFRIAGVYALGQLRWADGDVLLMGALEGEWGTIHGWRLGVMAHPEQQTVQLRPEMQMSLTDGVSLVVGGTYAHGTGQLPGANARSNQVHMKLTADF